MPRPQINSWKGKNIYIGWILNAIFIFCHSRDWTKSLVLANTLPQSYISSGWISGWWCCFGVFLRIFKSRIQKLEGNLKCLSPRNIFIFYSHERTRQGLYLIIGRDVSTVRKQTAWCTHPLHYCLCAGILQSLPHWSARMSYMGSWANAVWFCKRVFYFWMLFHTPALWGYVRTTEGNRRPG